MDETFLALTKFTQTWGLAYFLIIFVIAMAYALWPSRQKQFDEAARMPLRED
ncbi:MAG TPA: cbb3-type cytochrome c oxidase subunit 3 [Xanthobacteraceae bacterium]|nr:cbb3-type cytochrome c oxidase subunit 3 [Xanthobacteraceae bacterium]